MSKLLFAGFAEDTAATCISGLELRNHEGKSASGAAELRQLLKKEHWDLLLLSFAPDDDWVEIFMAELRSNLRTADLPVLAIVPSVHLSEIEKVFLLGVNDCVTRPFRVGALLDKALGIIADFEGTPTQPTRPALPDILEEMMLNICQNGRRLGDVSEIHSGVAAHNPKAHRLLCPSPEWTPAVIEAAVHPFQLGQEREFYLLRKDLMSRLPRPEEYDCPEKILIRRTFNPICAAIDTGQHIYNSSLYGIQTVKGLSCGFLCAVLNSRYSQFYFSRYRPPTEGLKGVYLSRADLDALPLLIPHPKAQRPLNEIVARLSILQTGNSNSSKMVERGKLMGELNRHVFNCLGFTEDAVKTLSELHF